MMTRPLTLARLARCLAAILALALVVVDASVPVTARDVDATSAQPARPTRTIRYESTQDDIPNPERGLYGWASSMAEGPAITPIAPETLHALRARDLTLVRIYYVIDEFREAPLSSEALARIDADFNLVRDAGLKVIPRFTYNFPTGELGVNLDLSGVADAPVGRVREHIAQLAPLLRRHADVIAFLEAGFIGAWGEWHHSSHHLVDEDGSINADSRLILDDLLAALPSTRTVALRYPFHKQQLFGNEPLDATAAFSGAPQARVGAHNDCFLRDAVDSGTYSRPGEYLPPPAFVDAQKRYLAHDNRFVPQGGETCAADRAARPYIGCSRSLDDLKRLRWSALNADFHPVVIRGWRQKRCLDDIRRLLGYRLRLSSAEVPLGAIAGGPLALSLTVVNEGWAAPYNPRPVELVLIHVATGARHTLAVSADPRFWSGGETQRVDVQTTLPDSLPDGDYRLLLRLPDPEPQLRDHPVYSIRFANKQLWQADAGLNDLRARVLVATPTSAESTAAPRLDRIR